MKDVITEILTVSEDEVAAIEEAVATALMRLGVDLDGRWISLRGWRHEHEMKAVENVRGGTLSIDYLVKRAEVSE